MMGIDLQSVRPFCRSHRLLRVLCWCRPHRLHRRVTLLISLSSWSLSCSAPLVVIAAVVVVVWSCAAFIVLVALIVIAWVVIVFDYALLGVLGRHRSCRRCFGLHHVHRPRRLGRHCIGRHHRGRIRHGLCRIHPSRRIGRPRPSCTSTVT